MSFKLHLAIVCFITVIVFIAWQISSQTPVPTEPVTPKTTTYLLAITHASWGLNCSKVPANPAIKQSDPFAHASADKSTNSKLRQDNVISQVSLLCNGKPQCEILADPSMLGEDPAPECSPKMIEIEYRCFSYDRPRQVQTTNANISLQCITPQEPTPQP